MRGALLATQKGETQGEEPLITLLDTALREKIFLLRIAIWLKTVHLNSVVTLNSVYVSQYL